MIVILLSTLSIIISVGLLGWRVYKVEKTLREVERDIYYMHAYAHERLQMADIISLSVYCAQISKMIKDMAREERYEECQKLQESYRKHMKILQQLVHERNQGMGDI